MRKTLRRFAVTATAILAATVMVAGCSGGGDNDGTGGDGNGSADSGELNFVYMGDANQQKAFKALFAEFNKDYPDIKVVKAQGIAGPDFAGDAQKVADAMLSQNPDLSGIWAVWDVPAEGVMAAARAAG